jgi:DNA-binding response OmpR family regulator
MGNSQDTGKKFILLIEDEEIMVNLLQNRLEKAGYLVKVARDGVRGLSMIRELEPDLVLLDMMLPVLNGFGVLEKLYEEKLIPKLPVVIISNSGLPIEIEHALKLGVRDYLIKVNFEPNELLAKVSRLLANESREESQKEQKDHRKKNGLAPEARILIIEDDLLLSGLLVKKFAQGRYAVERAVDIGQARKILGASRVDLILLDIVLPGEDGFTFLAELKKDPKLKNIPVVIISNLGQHEAVERGMKAGAADYIIKANVIPTEIVKKVEALLKKPTK